MGKDREGNFHPPKGKPSGSGKEQGVGLTPPTTGSMEQYLEMAEKYTDGADELPANVKVRHPNRNVNKGEDRKEQPESKNSYKSKTQTFKDERASVTPEELPGVLTKELFTDLVNYHGDLCVSAYLPTHRAGVDVNENADNIAFKTLLQNIAGTLKQQGRDQTTIQRILEPGYELLRNDGFWKALNNGLAVFMSDGYFKYVKMPDTPIQEVLVNSSFMVKPLVNAMTVNEYFYLLVLSKKQAKLFKADAFDMTLVEIDEMPNGVTDVVHFEEKDDEKLFRSEGAQGGKSSNLHGHGAGKPSEKEHLALYMDEVDETIWKEVLNRENVPLLLAGVEYLLPIFKSVSQYNNIWPEVLTGSREHDDVKSLFQEARKVMEPHFRERTKKALTIYANQSATALTSSIAADVMPAAHYSQVAHLFVKRGKHIWGTFNEMDNVLDIHEEKQDGDECLIDKAVIKTILNGGDVHFVSDEDMPGDTNIAAVMRF